MVSEVRTHRQGREVSCLCFQKLKKEKGNCRVLLWELLFGGSDPALTTDCMKNEPNPESDSGLGDLEGDIN